MLSFMTKFGILKFRKWKMTAQSSVIFQSVGTGSDGTVLKGTLDRPPDQDE